MKQIMGIITLSMLVFFVSCSGSAGEGGDGYQDIIDAGWTSFADGDYETAFDHFSDAIDSDPEKAEGYAGQAWSLMLMDFIDQASGTFNTGSTKTNPTADLYAGWGFVLNAQKSYANANAKIAQALTMDPGWNLIGGTGLNLGVNDLHVCKAENHFMLGEFSQSLAEVKIINTSFALSAIATDDDKAALALEIQRLKGLSKRE